MEIIVYIYPVCVEPRLLIQLRTQILMIFEMIGLIPLEVAADRHTRVCLPEYSKDFD